MLHSLNTMLFKCNMIKPRIHMIISVTRAPNAGELRLLGANPGIGSSPGIRFATRPIYGNFNESYDFTD